MYEPAFGQVKRGHLREVSCTIFDMSTVVFLLRRALSSTLFVIIPEYFISPINGTYVGKDLLGKSQKCVTELETIIFNKICLAMRGEGFTVYITN